MKNYSCQTVLIELVDIYTWSMEFQEVNRISATDLRTFNTVDNGILFNVLKNKLGVTYKALAFFSSYVRPSKVNVNQSHLRDNSLECTLPQRCCLGPIPLYYC